MYLIMIFMITSCVPKQLECFPVNPQWNSQSLNTTRRPNALGQAQGLCLSARSGVSVQASAILSMFIRLSTNS